MGKIMKAIGLLLAVALVAISVIGCTADPVGQSASEDAAPSEADQNTGTEDETGDQGARTVTDHAGHEVVLPESINRVVVCDIYPLPSILTVFFDSAEKLVGIAKPSMAAAKSSLLGELYPEILEAETGFIDGTTVNIEELLKLEPDLVFVNAGNKDLYEAVVGAGLTAFGISAGKWGYDALETLNQWVLTLDQIFEGNSKYEVVDAYGKQVQALIDERLQDETSDERVMFLFQYTAEQILVNGNPSFGSWWSSAIGLPNVVTEKTEANSLPVGMEQIYEWDPTVIFVTNFTTATADDLYGNTVGEFDWSSVSAVKNKRVYKMPLGMYRSYTSGVDSPIALLWLAKAAYPEKFEDVDITEYTKEYYESVFGVKLTDEQADSIFDPDPNAGRMQ